ncbi:ATP-binding protein [Cryptosporangium sp. NPDC051539]|uniref:sensor histidine kinase n=1 Tax=Cryptosporangium sp. NPDC051539 TaxID=3363962 RepID=UPI0037BC56E5
MSNRWPGLWIASVLATLGVLGTVTEIAVYLGHWPGNPVAAIELVQWVAGGAPVAVVGYLLVARRTAPGLGWLLLCSATLLAAAACLDTWLRFVTTVTPGVEVALYAEYALWELPRWGYPLLPLFLATGRLAGRPARLLAAGLAVVILPTEISRLLALPAWHPGTTTVGNALFAPGWVPIDRAIQPFLLVTGWGLIAVICVYPLTQWRTATRLQRRRIVLILPPFVLLMLEEGIRQHDHWSVWIAAGKVATAALWPVALGYTVLQTRLYDLDRAARRTLAVAVPVMLLAVFYVGAAAAMSLVLPGRSARMLAALAVLSAPLGLVLRSVSGQVLRRVDRMLYGDRAEPYQLARELAARVRDGTSANQVPNAVCQVVVNALRLPGAALRVTVANGVRELAAVGDLTPGRAEALDLRHDGRLVGVLLVMPRSGQATLDELDHAALRPLADLAATAVAAVLLEEELASSRARLVTVREEERSRLRRDVHDGIGSALAAVRLRIEAAVALLPPEVPVRPLLAGASDDLRDVLTEMRRITDDLRPPALDRLGLRAALADLADRYTTPSLRVRADLPDESGPLSPLAELAIYRIAAEALANTVRHAAATRAVLRLTVDVDELILTVADNGTGIDPRRTGSGIGLTSMTERAAELGGECEVRSAPTGTTVTTRLPAHAAVGGLPG